MLRRWAQVAILGLTGLYFTYNLFSGNVTNYIAEKFVWLSWIAAGLLLVLAGMQAVGLLRGSQYGHEHGHHHEHDHDPHTPDTPKRLARVREWASLGIVFLPFLFGVLVPSQPLDSRSVEGEIAADLSSIDVISVEEIEDNPLDRNVLEWQRAFAIESDPTTFNGQQADVIGFVYRDARFDPATQFLAARFVISCCVADAMSIGLVVEWPEAASLKQDSWVRVRGSFEAKLIDGQLRPVLVVAPGGIERIAQPANPYLYP